jgi:hypothetical protein
MRVYFLMIAVDKQSSLLVWNVTRDKKVLLNCPLDPRNGTFGFWSP